MVGITEYLEGIYNDFRAEIESGKCLCELKGLTFESGCLPDYNNIQIQRLYLLRYAFAYGFEYSHIYSNVLNRLHNPGNIVVTSIGCGNFLDYWALVKAIEKKRIDCNIRYVGIDEINWNYKVAKRAQDEVCFRQENAVNSFQVAREFVADVYFFPKSISEFSDEEIKIIAESFNGKIFRKNKIIFCFSIRANEYSRDRDMKKTQQIIGALEANGYKQNTDKNTWWYFRDDKGIITYENSYLYPQDAYDYVVGLNKKCIKYIESRINCEDGCERYLNRKPTTKTGNITYQIIELERIQE